MLITNNEEIAKRARLLRSHGMTTMSYQRSKGHATAYDIVDLGYNFRMDDIRASIGCVQMRKLQTDLERRVRVRDKYVEELSKIEGLVVPFAGNTEFVSNYIMPWLILRKIREKK